MLGFKLQIGCLIIILYFSVVYIKATNDKKVPCNRIYEAILILAPLAVILDGATAYTVNHMDTVPEWLNLLLHGVFFIFMDALIIFLFVYLIDKTVGIKHEGIRVLLYLPGALTILAILNTLLNLHYVKGKTTYYSMGIPVYICFASLLIHFTTLIVVVLMNRNRIEERKITGLFAFMTVIFVLLLSQVIFPELLITSLLPTITVIGIFIMYEDPSLKRVVQLNDDMITGFAALVESRDNSTGGHIKRTKEYVNIIMLEMKHNPKYRKIVTNDYLRDVVNAAPMHDIGKISTPDYILQKPGKLDDEEYRIMKQHSPIGGEIIKEILADTDDEEYKVITYEIARYHHEKWNGKGYPDGIAGEDIPLHARVMAIADVFDAVSAKRVYRDAMPLEKCFSIIREGAGSDFDPDLVNMFFKSQERIVEYYNANK